VGFPDPKKEHARFLEVIAAWGFTPESEAYALEYYEEYADSLEDGQIIVDEFVDSARIACFCKNVRNLLMWSHYADGLRGFCIEFDKARLLEGNEDKAAILDVLYEHKPPIVDTSVYAVAEDQIAYHEEALHDPSTETFAQDYRNAAEEARQLVLQLYSRMLATKPLAWQYEEESRLIFHSRQRECYREPFKYGKEAVKAVILGERMPGEQREEILKILNESGLRALVKTASRRRGSYEIIID
jgi:hypothetical protein